MESAKKTGHVPPAPDALPPPAGPGGDGLATCPGLGDGEGGGAGDGGGGENEQVPTHSEHVWPSYVPEQQQPYWTPLHVNEFEA